MIRTFVGVDYAGAGCIKITKGERDPNTIPDSEVSAFLYNSKWSKDVNVKSVKALPFVGANVGDSTYRIIVTSGPVNDYYLTNAYFGGSIYDFPLFDHKETHPTTGRFQQGKTRQTFRGYGDRGGAWESGSLFPGAWYQDYVYGSTPRFSVMGVFKAANVDDDYYDPVRAHIVTWSLPGDDNPIIDGAPLAPVTGQIAVQIDSARCRVAKPGYNLPTATETQLAFDSSKRPPKVIAAADIALPSGTSSYDLGRSLPAGSLPDVYFYTATDALYFPTNPTDFVKGAEYWIDGQFLRFSNPNGACRARFIIIAGNDEPPTSGSNKVWHEFEEGGQPVMQFLRPGASANPSFGDIIVDSRWPCLQMLAEGYIPVGNGALQHVVPINAAGMFPIVKYTTVHGGVGGFRTWSKEIRAPRTRRIGLYRTGWQAIQDAGDSTYCRVTSTEARFFTFKGSPIAKFYENAQAFDQNRPSTEGDPNPILGIRYYVFGIPAP